MKNITRISPCGGGHDAASTINSHPAATAALWGVMVHAKIVSQLMCQSYGCTQRVLRVILRWKKNTDHENMLIECILVCLTMCEVQSKLFEQALSKNPAIT